MSGDAITLPEGYKMTELGLLPGEWQVVRLGEVASFDRGVSWSKGDESQSGIIVVSIPDIASNGKITISPRVRISKAIHQDKLLREGDILLVGSSGSVRNIGRTGLITDLGSLSVTFASFTVRARAKGRESSQAFLLCLLPSQWVPFHLFSKRAADGKYNLQVQQLRGHPIPLPPLPEQRAIAHVLRTLQRAKEATERVIAAARELKKSLMQHLFTYGPVPLDAADRVQLKETEIGTIPAHWQVVRLGEVGRVITGRTPSTKHKEYWNGSIPFVTPVDLKGGSIWYAARSITEKGLKHAKPIPRGAVLVSCIGYIGKVGILERDVAATNQQINAILPLKCENWFLVYAIMQEVELLKSRARMTTVPILHKTNFEHVPIPLPPLSEQREIARILQAVDKKIAAEERRKAALEALFKTLLGELMTGRRRVANVIIGAT